MPGVQDYDSCTSPAHMQLVLPVFISAEMLIAIGTKSCTSVPESAPHPNFPLCRAVCCNMHVCILPEWAPIGALHWWFGDSNPL